MKCLYAFKKTKKKKIHIAKVTSLTKDELLIMLYKRTKLKHIHHDSQSKLMLPIKDRDIQMVSKINIQFMLYKRDSCKKINLLDF